MKERQFRSWMSLLIVSAERVIWSYTTSRKILAQIMQGTIRIIIIKYLIWSRRVWNSMTLMNPVSRKQIRLGGRGQNREAKPRLILTTLTTWNGISWNRQNYCATQSDGRTSSYPQTWRNSYIHLKCKLNVPRVSWGRHEMWYLCTKMKGVE